MKEQNPHPYRYQPSIELDEIDSNCNNCKFMVRDIEKFKSFNCLHEGKKNSRRINYGVCTKFKKDVSFIPTHCMPENELCFEHRRKN